MKLRAESILIAQQLQEAADAMTASDTRDALSDAVSDAHKDSGYGYLLDHMGDDESGDAVYRSNGETMQAPYTMTGGNGFAKKAKIDTANAMKVRGRMVYEPTCDEGDHIAAMSEALKTAKLYTELPVYERFIAKAERDAADDSDFAGKGKSFPILKREDVMAAVRSIGRAGSDNHSSATIKANIIAIAKRKGWADELPKAWQAGTKKEAAKPGNTTGLRLIESAGCAFLGDVPVREAARTSYPIKIISPGTGSSAHYTEACLKNAAQSGAFKKGTFMFWNHPTEAQEHQRPEGDLNDLAAITTSDGEYREAGAKGPGIYADAKVMADYADKIEARAGHIGLSIRAGGTGSGKTVDGKPVLASIDHVESVDYVTRAGRGGMALAESEKFTQLLESFKEGEVSEMDAAEIRKLQESLAAQTAINARLLARAMRADALELAGAVLATTTLTEGQRKFVAESVVGTSDAPREIPTKDGVLDAAKLTESVNAAAKAYSATLPATGGVRGMGAGLTVVQESADVKAARAEALKETQAREVRALVELGLSEAAAKESVGVAA
jgi:hypothetical protein